MALTTCRECGRSGVSTDPKGSCPGCGATNPGNRPIRNAVIGLVVVVIGLIGMMIWWPHVHLPR